MNIARCVHFRDFSVGHCALAVSIKSVRDHKGRVPCIACGPLAQPVRDVKCEDRYLPTEAEVDAWMEDIARRAGRLPIVDDEEPPL